MLWRDRLVLLGHLGHQVLLDPLVPLVHQERLVSQGSQDSLVQRVRLVLLVLLVLLVRLALRDPLVLQRPPKVCLGREPF
jgi:hypothetical protein